MPYGCKPHEIVTARCLKVADHFLEQGVKAIVVACNTATALSIQTLRQRYEVPIIGMEPPLKPAVIHSRSGVVGILATSATVSSDRFHALKQRFSGDAQWVVQPCPGLVEQIEQGELTSQKTRAMLIDYLRPLLEQGVDTIVLGCTHYPFVMPLITEIAGAGVRTVDTGDAIARELKRQLQLSGTLCPQGQSGAVQFWSTAVPDEPLISTLWGQPLSVGQLDIG